MKNYEQLTFTDDFMFCKVLTTNPQLCHELLERKYVIIRICQQLYFSDTLFS